MSTYSVAFIQCDGFTDAHRYSCGATFDSGKRSVAETREDAEHQGWATSLNSPGMRGRADFCRDHAPRT